MCGSPVYVTDPFSMPTYLHWFPPQDEEVLCSHHHETHELMAKNLLNLICLQHQWTVRIKDTGLILT